MSTIAIIIILAVDLYLLHLYNREQKYRLKYEIALREVLAIDGSDGEGYSDTNTRATAYERAIPIIHKALEIDDKIKHTNKPSKSIKLRKKE